MPVFVITGNDTGVGKTRVTAALARELSRLGGAVQIVKPVETGILPGGHGDAETALRHASGKAEAHTLFRFAEPMSPPDAAKREGFTLTLESMLERYRRLPPAAWRLVEGAGGIASPLDTEGRDVCDFAAAIGADALILVVEHRLGAICQARLAHAYAARAGVPVWLWLNQIRPESEAVLLSNREALTGYNLPLCAVLGPDAQEPDWLERPWQATPSR
ncbi:dethiobiotin synthase [Ruficoccus amylovorans]|uniref:ATP-dependent dethiobiotin synthetase BioD n=1 Tax=Ruficoccus amylovorans TaxID=1804625 RepID=A0A842HAY0_9BACT|nr:dethiobiotin synthase [Ruficoccus amylovorans]MBC2593633.1 dethiobiotin synthase [Ruficoccus amylovorans]